MPHNNTFHLALLFLVICCNSAAQILIKFYALSTIEASLLEVLNIYLFLAILCMGIAFLAWQILLSKVDLSMVHPALSLTQIIVPILAFVFLNEEVHLSYWLGLSLVVYGIYCTTKSTDEAKPRKNIP